MSKRSNMVMPAAWLISFGSMAGLVLFSGCGGDPVTAENSGYQADGASGSADGKPTTDGAATDGGAAGGGNPVTSPPAFPRDPVVVAGGDGGASPAVGVDEIPPSRPAPVAVDTLESYDVPNGSAEQIFQFLNTIEQQRPRGVTMEEKLADMRKIHQARITAAEKILSANPPAKDEFRRGAANSKFDALGGLGELGTPNVQVLVKAFCVELAADRDPDLQHMGRLVLFGVAYQEFGESEKGDSAAVISALKNLLALEDKNAETLSLANQSAHELDRAGFHELAMTIFDMTAQAYATHSDPEYAAAATQLAHNAIITYEVQKLIDGKEAVDPNRLIQSVDVLLADEKKSLSTVQAAIRAGNRLSNTPNQNLAAEIYRRASVAFQGSKDPQLAAASTELAERVRIVQSSLDIHTKKMIEGDAGAEANVAAAARTLLSTPNPGPFTFEAVRQAAQWVEMEGYYVKAVEIYDLIGAAFQRHENTELAAIAQKVAANGKTRAGLVGKPFTVTGANLDGTTFDWSKYRGKVVLIDFWATWCVPCRAEMPNIAASYEKFRDKGFEVIGVNIDDDQANIGAFVAANKIPWPTVVTDNPQAAGFESPMAQLCGVDSIPFIVLVNREGIVEALHVRGEKLEPKLIEMLGTAP